MTNDINIQQVVQQIWHPNVTLSFNSGNDSYHSLLFNLVRLARQIVHEKLHTPFVQVKDIKGNLFYNDYITITYDQETVLDMMEDFDFAIDLIHNHKYPNELFCSLYSEEKINSPITFDCMSPHITNRKLNKMEYLKVISDFADTHKLSRRFSGEDKGKVLVHKIDLKRKTWAITTIMNPHN